MLKITFALSERRMFNAVLLSMILGHADPEVKPLTVDELVEKYQDTENQKRNPLYPEVMFDFSKIKRDYPDGQVPLKVKGEVWYKRKSTAAQVEYFFIQIGQEVKTENAKGKYLNFTGSIAWDEKLYDGLKVRSITNVQDPTVKFRKYIIKTIPGQTLTVEGVLRFGKRKDTPHMLYGLGVLKVKE